MPMVIGAAYTSSEESGGGGGGGGGTPTLIAVTSAHHAGWTQIPDPHAYRSGGKTYFGPWVNGSNGYVEVCEFVHATQLASSPVALYTGGPVDNHGSGSLIVREQGTGAQADGRLVAGRSAHDGTNMGTWISSNPTDATAFGSVTVDGSGDYTYLSHVQFSDGTIYRFYRNISGGTGRLAYKVSTDGGASYGSEVLLFTGAAGKVPYWRIGTNWTDRIDFYVTDDSPNVSTTQLYHFYLTASGRFKSDGTSIATALPITVADCTLVHNNTGGPVWSWGGSWDGDPATVIMQSLSGTDCKIIDARWRSGAWQKNTVVASVGGILDSNLYASGCAIHHENPDIKLVAQKVGSHWEMFRYTSPDDGVTHAGSQLTSGSSVDNVWPDFVHRGLDSALEGFWLQGTYTSDIGYDFAIQGEYLV